MLPPKDCTNNIYSVWADLSHFGHLTILAWTGQRANEIRFSFRKGIKETMLNNQEPKQGHTRVAPLRIPRYWYNKNSDDTSTTCLTLNNARPFTDSTVNTSAIMAGPGRGYDDLGSRGELYVFEIDSRGLGEDSQGRDYNMVQCVINPTFGPPPKTTVNSTGNLVSVLGILSQPRYGGRACTTPKASVGNHPQ